MRRKELAQLSTIKLKTYRSIHHIDLFSISVYPPYRSIQYIQAIQAKFKQVDYIHQAYAVY